MDWTARAMPLPSMTEHAVQALLTAIFWLGVVTLVYVYILYPVAVWVAASLRRERPIAPAAPETTNAISVVVAVRNEAARIRYRLDELLELIRTTGCPAEIIVVTDGCTDETADLARSCQSSLVRVIEQTEPEGKAQALTRGCQVARGRILVFADVRQRWGADSLQRLLGNFARPEVGAVGGELVVDAPGGVLSGVGLYWRYEKWLRRNEAVLHSTVGVSGSICAVRRELFQPIPPGVLLDDLYWPLRVVMGGHRVIYEERAVAYDRLPERAADEFRRKVRTLSGNFQLAAALPQALLPWRNPIWAQFVSHKLLRLAVPWLLLAVFAASALLPGPLYRITLVVQLIFYGLALLALTDGPVSRWGVTAATSSFVLLNAAAWVAFWVWICGGAERAWTKVTYDVRLPPE